MTVCPHPEDPVPTLNWVYENQPIASGILKQPSRYKRTESNLLADEKVPNSYLKGVRKKQSLNFFNRTNKEKFNLCPSNDNEKTIMNFEFSHLFRAL